MGAGEAARLPALAHKRTWIPLSSLCQRVQKENLNRGRGRGQKDGREIWLGHSPRAPESGSQTKQAEGAPREISAS